MNVAEELQKLEESLLRNSVRREAEKLSSLLAEEFCEFGSSGVAYSKAEIVASLKNEGDLRIAMREFACRMVAENIALVTYRSERVDESGDSIEALRSSLWIFRDARWQMVFHQGTRVTA